MSSKVPTYDEAYVWVWLPGATAPVVAGRLHAHDEIVSFNYGQSYRALREAIPLYLPELPLKADGAERLFYGLSERDADVFGGVMMVDMEVADRLDRDVDARMAGEQIEHVVEKADPGGDIGHACAVEVHAHLDIGLLGLALDGGAAHENAFLVPKTRPF